MAACCAQDPSTEGTNYFFNRWSKKYAKQFRKGKLEKEQRLLLEGVRKSAVVSQEILDIGCGVGALHLTLLKEGAAKSTGVDIADGMLERAKEFAEQLGLTEKTSYINGDFVRVSDSLADADITMLDKVVCCYEDVETLVRKSSAKTRKVYALTHPRESLFVASTFKIQIFFSKLFRAKFHPFWHNWADVRRIITDSGFVPLYENSTFTWSVVVYRRA